MRRLIFSFCLFASFVSYSQDSTKLPTLGDHIFVPIPSTRNPQPVTNFNTLLGYSVSENNAIFRGELPDGSRVSLDGTLTFANLGANLAFKLKDWASLQYRFQFSTRLGTDINALFSQGYTDLTVAELYWKIRLFESNRFVLSTVFGVNRIEGQVVDVAGYVRELLDGNPNASLQTNYKSLTGELGLLGAYTFGQGLFAVNLDVTLEQGNELDGQSLNLYWETSLAFDVNFNQRYNVPLGLALSYFTTTLPEEVYEEERTSQSFWYKIAYTGSKEFSLGLIVTRSWVPLPRIDEKVRSLGYQLGGQFYF